MIDRAPAGTDGGLSGLHPRTRDWIRLEQTVNERLVNTRALVPIAPGTHTVEPAYWPEREPLWRQRVVWLPRGRARVYGRVEEEVRDAFGLGVPADRAPLFVHAQAPRSHRRLGREHGSAPAGDVRVTPTASYRSVLAWTPSAGRRAVVLKLSLDAVIGRAHRALGEGQVARAVVISTLLDTIPAAHRRDLALDWFSEPAGVVETLGRTGWVLRRLPALLRGGGRGRLVPAFSLVARGEDELPLLVRQIRLSGRRPEAFVVDAVLRPYVRALAYLLFEQGLQYEGHLQNVLLEVREDGTLSGRFVLRDLSDTTVNLAYRVARRLPLPTPDIPRDAPFPISTNALDFVSNFERDRVRRGYDTVERYGLWGFVWPINTVLARWFRAYDRARVSLAYLRLWQEAARFYTNVTPIVRRRPPGMATDEAVAYYLRHTDWRALGGVRASLPAGADPLLVEGRARRCAGRVYERVECAWGDLFVRNGLPEFFHARV